MKTYLTLFLLSLISVVAPSVLVGFAFWLIFNVFIAPALLTAGILIIAGVVSNDYMEHQANMSVITLEKKRVENLKYQSVQLQCAYCRTEHIVPVQVNERNTFVCENPKCGHTNLIIFQYSAAQITTPLVASEVLTPVEVK